MADMSLKSELRNTWESAAPGWAKWEHVFTTGFASATDALIDMADIRPGMRILDLACGAGSQTIQAARRVGPNGQVVASDISGTMLEHVRRNAASEGLQNIETLECAADELDKTQAPFDASMCRMGLMLFPSLSKAVEAVRLVLKPGARFAALVFTTPANNPFLAQPMAVLLRHAGKSPPALGQPGLFALGASGTLERLMKDNGFVGVEMNILRPRLALPSVSDALRLLQEGAGAYRAAVADLGDEAKSKAWHEVHECLTQFEVDGSFETELEVVVGSGARPR
jgi:ubiquinone/menaquinone biosynthesis C-methylase UbiE